MSFTLKKANALYCVIEALAFLCQCLIYTFASAYMLGRGYSNTVIGVILFLGSVFSILLMQIIAYVEKKRNLSINKVSICIAFLIFILGAGLYFLNLNRILVCIFLCTIITCSNSQEYYVNSLYRGYYNRGLKINFPLARGVGSLAFALCSLVVGRIFVNRSVLIMPAIYSFFALILVVLLSFFNAPNVEKKHEEAKQSILGLLKGYPHFTLFLVAVFFIVCSSLFICTFMLQIVQSVGGGIEDSGTALFFAAILELPAMVVYKKLSDKIGNRKLLFISMVIAALKHILISISPSPVWIWAAQVLQFMGYAMYIPATERHISHVVPASFYIRAQALLASVGFIASITSSLFGGILIDRIGVFHTFIIIDILSIIGVIFAHISLNMSYKKIPKTAR